MKKVIDDNGFYFMFDEDIKFLSKFGVDKSILITAQLKAEKFNISASQALIVNGLMTEIEYYRCLAFELDLPFVDTIDEPVIERTQTPNIEELYKMARLVAVRSHSHIYYHIAPDCRRLNALKKHLQQFPELKNRLKVTTPSVNFTYLERSFSASLLRHAVNRLYYHFPHFSARHVLFASQPVVLFCFFEAIILTVFFGNQLLLAILYFFSILLYLANGVLKLLAAQYVKKGISDSVQHNHILKNLHSDNELPYYSIMIALYDEANQVNELFNAIHNIDWPLERLEVKFVCEADDYKTIKAVQTALTKARKSTFSLVCVPPSEPRTKPKALNYALPLCRGEYLVIYDAEDRPSPLQLREAYWAFQNGPKNLACVQAPLYIHNRRKNWLTRIFAFEYAVLFRGLLPLISAMGGPVPLGGTSNHFKRQLLHEIGGWDPYNVTEDADLGIRLARANCSVGVITQPTYEEAPQTYSIWFNQRCRWFKGWYQTWLVHMRHPLKLVKELGLFNALLFHCIITSMVISVLIHPFILYFLFSNSVDFWYWKEDNIPISPLFPLDLLIVFSSYLSFVYLTYTIISQDLRQKKYQDTGLNIKRSSLIVLLTLPFYWLLLSISAWRAVYQLIHSPHYWAKTPHGHTFHKKEPLR